MDSQTPGTIQGKYQTAKLILPAKNHGNTGRTKVSLSCKGEKPSQPYNVVLQVIRWKKNK